MWVCYLVPPTVCGKHNDVHLAPLPLLLLAVLRPKPCPYVTLKQNMYCVLRGEKHFTLLPPSDVLFLYEQEFPQGRYRHRRDTGDDDSDGIRGDGGSGGEAGSKKGKFEVEMEEGTVPWIPVGEFFAESDTAISSWGGICTFCDVLTIVFRTVCESVKSIWGASSKHVHQSGHRTRPLTLERVALLREVNSKS